VIPITLVPKGSGFSFEKLDRSFVSFGDGHTCNMERIGTVHIKLSDGERVEGCEV